ncbi:ROK family transcriptional regulator [uncultured Cohaesibacter sp.]|uniref:ROK family transcriptional regulator n=1 Tax=uncultured Cohaesibacter sp. TaxID=1002546 RepID=UPI0029C824AA|nr:ROK family transcriptional regulator [uncultured Cohaesibacter sp.]
MTMPKTVRHINEIRTLEALLKHGPMSRADIARTLDVTRATASSLVSSLVEGGFLFEDSDSGEERPNRTGRPSTRVALKPQHAIFLGAYMTVGRITLAAVDLVANVIAVDVMDYEPRLADAAHVAKLMAARIKTFIARLPSPDRINGLNIAVPGLVDLEGTIIRAPMLGWKDISFRPLIQAALPEIEVSVLDNDANAFAFEELYLGKRSELREAIYVFIDDGVGGCLVCNGEILRGFNGYAGEIGHIIVGEEGYFSPTAVKGTLESFVARQAVLARYRSLGGSAASISDFIKDLNEGSEAARATLKDWSYYLGRGIATLTSMLNPECIILGGAVARLYPLSEQDVLKSMRDHLMPKSKEPQIKRSNMGVEAPAIGAARMLHRDFFMGGPDKGGAKSSAEE